MAHGPAECRKLTRPRCPAKRLSLGAIVEESVSVIAHCDWSIRANKRWMAVAVREGRQWKLGAPELVGDCNTLLARLNSRAREDGALVVGFDFPIGLPASYGRLTGFRSFREAISTFGHDGWEDWYRVASHAEEISLRRPFYPMRPGGTFRSHLLDGLGIGNPLDLMRLCERPADGGHAACMLFWTLGGNQVGKAAISGWQEIIVPNISDVGLWPFDGTLPELVTDCPVVIVETYPGDVYGQLGIPRHPVWSKQKQDGRRFAGETLLACMTDPGLSPESDLVELVRTGFSSRKSGEDPFDATVGLMGMLAVVRGHRSEGVPSLPGVETWEGWILGKKAGPWA